MTTPLIPTVDFEAPLLNPLGYGLAAAATIHEDDGGATRILGGVRLWPHNCSEGSGTYPYDLCLDDDTPPLKEAGDRPAPEVFLPVVVWAADECQPDQTNRDGRENQDRANQILKLREPALVESAFATRLLADAGVAATAPDFASALGMIEEFMGEQGYPGVIHAARRWAPAATQYRWTNQSGPILRSPLGHAYAFGGGYSDTLGDTLVVTGQVHMWRSTIDQQISPDPQTNTLYALAERVVVVGYECVAYAVTIEETP